MPYAAIAFQEKTTGEIRIAHYFSPTKSPFWTTPFGVTVDAPGTIANWKVC